jgi:hypothetical protein
MSYKLIKAIANSKSFRWGTPLRKYDPNTIDQKTLKALYNKGCEFVTEDSKPKKSKKNGESKENNNEN